MKINLPVTDREVVVPPGTTIVSRTNPKGAITYVNEEFIRYSGFSEQELLGRNHNLVRHPDMPPAAFEDLWSKAKNGEPWQGLVKNRCKNGDFYWVFAQVIPIIKEGEIQEYMSVRSAPNREQIPQAETLYRQLMSGQPMPKPTMLQRLRLLPIQTKSQVLMLFFMIAALFAGLFHYQITENIAKHLSNVDSVSVSVVNQVANLQQAVTLGIVALVISLGVTLYWLVRVQIQTNLQGVLKILGRINQGDFDNTFDHQREDEFGTLEKGLHILQVRQSYELADARKKEQRANRFNQGLECASTNVLLADRLGRIIYVNQSVSDWFAANPEAYTELGSQQLLGAQIDQALKKEMSEWLSPSGQSDSTHFQCQFAHRTLQVACSVIREQGSPVPQGVVLEWEDVTEALAEQQRQTKVSATNARIKQALDNVSTNVMVADADRNIVYLNRSLEHMFVRLERQLKEELPHFDARTLVGTNMDGFHRNPGHQAQLLAELTQPYETEIHLGALIFGLTANPVLDDQGQRIGTVMEWADRTDEVAMESEIDHLVSRASVGNLTGRLKVDNKSGFYRTLSDRLNQLIAISEAIITDTARVLHAIARGDLSQTIQQPYEGTFGKLKEDTNETVARLAEFSRHIQQSAETVSTGAGEIAQGNTDLSQRTEEQASSLQETAANMEQMTSAVRQAANNASEANELAQQAQSRARSGGKVVEKTVAAMEDIQHASNRIADIIGVIDDIAFQTNLLALNAAVEAARAGEQGRGFAVVASEVRGLAKRSADAAKEIKGLIQDSVAKVASGTSLVTESGDTLATLVQAVEQVSAKVEEITLAAQEQGQGIEQVNQAIGQMDSMTQQNAALVEQVSASGLALAEQSQQLMSIIQFFRSEMNE